MWGVFLRGLPFLADLGKGALTFAKNHKLLTTGVGLTTGAFALSGKDKEEQTQQNQTPQQNQILQQKHSQTKPKSKSSKNNDPINLPPLSSLFPQGSNPSSQDELVLPQELFSSQGNLNPSQTYVNTEGSKLSQIANQIQELFTDLDKYRQMYEILTQQYLQANEIYEKQLLQTIQAIPFLTAKTPLNNMTTEDLNEHLNNLFTSMPYTEALEKVNQLTKGYYIAKMNGVDPKTLSTTDLILIAENPALAKSVNDNIVQFLEQMGEILKYKIKSNMDSIGALKDQYQNLLKELEEKGKLYKEIIDAYRYEMNLDFNREKFYTKLNFDKQKLANEMAYKFATLNEKRQYHNKSLALKEAKTKNDEDTLSKFKQDFGVK